jgi:acyl-CoA dehydrogenase
MNALSAKLAPMADLSLLVLAGDLKKAEMLSARLGDVMSYMYAAMAVVRFYEQRVESRKEALPYFEYAIQWCLNKGETALNEFIVNFPNTAVRGLMRVLTNTYTTAVKGISDDLKRQLSEASMQDTSIKAQLTHLVKVIPGDGNDINEQAFKAKHAVLPQLKRIQKALRKTPVVPFISFEHAVGKLQEAGEITAQDLALVIEYNDKRKLAIRVDEFTFDMDLLNSNLELLNEEEIAKANAA